MVYTIEKRQDKYFILNEGTSTINFEVKKLYDCVNFLTIYDGEILVGEEVEITFNGDGEYLVELTDDTTDVINIPIKHYLKLQLSMIDSIYTTICNCECECEDCKEDTCEELCDLLITRAKVDTYKRLINPKAVAFFDAVYKHTKCLIKKPIYCIIAEEDLLGEAKCNKKLIKQLLALDYLALYFYEYYQVSLSADKEYIRDKFKTNKIFCCIQKLGINVGDIEQLIENNMGLFTINSAAYVNQAPSEVGDYTLNVDNRDTTILTLAMFTSATTPVYSDPEGDAPSNVRIDTLPADGTLYLNGVAVTAGQVIPVADINNNLLTYESPNQDALDQDTFNFSVSDAGSGQFTS